MDIVPLVTAISANKVGLDVRRVDSKCVTIMQRCWAHDASKRPSATQLLAEMQMVCEACGAAARGARSLLACCRISSAHAPRCCPSLKCLRSRMLISVRLFVIFLLLLWLHLSLRFFLFFLFSLPLSC